MKNGTRLKINLKTEMVQEGQKESHVFNVTGQGVLKKDTLYILYDEEHVEGDGEVIKVPVMLKIVNDNQVELTRTTTHRSKLVFNQGQVTIMQYQTPYGLMPLEVVTHDIDYQKQIEEMSGQLNISYQLKAEQGVVGAYKMSLEYQEITN